MRWNRGYVGSTYGEQNHPALVELCRRHGRDLNFVGCVVFGGTTVAQLHGAKAVAEGFRRLGPIVARNVIKQLVVEGDRAAVLYDFVTDTAVGPVLTAEFLTVEDGLIRSITLLFDWRRWPEVLQELERRTAPVGVADAERDA